MDELNEEGEDGVDVVFDLKDPEVDTFHHTVADYRYILLCLTKQC